MSNIEKYCGLFQTVVILDSNTDTQDEKRQIHILTFILNGKI